MNTLLHWHPSGNVDNHQTNILIGNFLYRIFNRFHCSVFLFGNIFISHSPINATDDSKYPQELIITSIRINFIVRLFLSRPVHVLENSQ